MDHFTKKGIFILQEPYDFSTRQGIDSIFETTDEIKFFGYDQEPGSNDVIIVEEPRYVQIFEIQKITRQGNDDFFLKLKEENYVHDKFRGDGKFTLCNGMLYTKFMAYKTQKKGTEKKDTL
jgi:hypothetical protein